MSKTDDIDMVVVYNMLNGLDGAHLMTSLTIVNFK